MRVHTTLTAPRLAASAPSLPRLSRQAGIWAVAFAFLTVAAFSTAPSALFRGTADDPRWDLLPAAA